MKSLEVFHGPYSEYVERKLDSEDILRLMSGKTNRKAFYKEVLAYCEYQKEPITFTTFTRGTISQEISGNNGWNFDRIFILDGDKLTMANYSDVERAQKYSHENWIKLAEYIRSKNQLEPEK